MLTETRINVGMRFWRCFIAFLILFSAVTLGPVLTGHATVHALEKVVGHASSTDRPAITSAECGLCHAYQVQHSIIGVADLRLPRPIEARGSSLFRDLPSEGRVIPFFQARGPPSLFSS